MATRTRPPLDEYLRLQEYHFSQVGVVDSRGTIAHEFHPIAPDVLAILRKLWTQQYYQSQENDNQRDKQLEIAKKSLKK